MLLAPVLEFESEETPPKKMKLSIQHYLIVPPKDDSTQEDVHHIVRQEKGKQGRYTGSVKQIEEVKGVRSGYFTTDKLDHFCLISATGEEKPCTDVTKMYLSIVRRQGSDCPHPLTFYCYSEEDKKEFKKYNLTEDDEEESFLLNLCRNFKYDVCLGKGSEPATTIGQLSHDDVRGRGTVMVGQVPSRSLIDYRDTQNEKVFLKPNSDSETAFHPKRPFIDGLDISSILKKCFSGMCYLQVVYKFCRIQTKK